MRYTIKDMENMSDRQFIVNILEERRGKCTNPYSPLCERLNTARRTPATLVVG